MSHLHVPDGILPLPVVMISFLVCGTLVSVASHRLSRDRSAPLRIASVAALMVLSMNVPVLVLPLHLNMAALAGIVLGGWQALVAVFTVNLMVAFMQHGGITAVGLNTIILGAEAALASCVFRGARRLKAPMAAAVATTLALLLSTGLMVSVLAAAAPRGSVLEALAHDFRLPYIGGQAHSQTPSFAATPAFGRPLVPVAVVRIIAPVIAGGVLLEAAVTSLIVGFLSRVRPDLITRQR